MQTRNGNFRAYAKILNRPNFLALARGEQPRNIFNSIDISSLPNSVHTVNDLFGFAFNSNRKFYRNEYIYKTAIVNRVVFGRHSPRTSTLCTELPVGNSIADIAIFNGTSTAYEIKTELDSSRRLLSQTPDYLKAFEHIYIVTHPRLAEKYADSCHYQVGVASLNGRDSLKIIKPALSNLQNIDPAVIFRILRKYEFIAAIEKINGHPIKLANGLIRKYCQEIFCKLDAQEAHRIYLEALRQRSTGEESVQFLKSLPEYLRVLGYATSLSKIQKERLLNALELPLINT